MAYTKATMKAVDKYVKANYDRIEIKVPKGQKATVQAAAEAEGESINGYANSALLARMGFEEWPEVKSEDE